jgi:hypothetical protein
MLIKSTNGMGVLSMSRLAISLFSSIIVTTFLFFLPMGAFAHSGCCSGHGGVAGCNNSTNYQSCKDGTTSPSCGCDGSTTKPAKAAKTKAAPAAAAPAAAPAPAASTDNTVAAPTKSAKAKDAKAAKGGCFSGHGGVLKCDKTAGFQMCKDGTTSATCACGKKK